MERSQAVIMTAEHLHAAEAAIAAAYAQTADLAAGVIRLRQAAGLSPTVGHQALDDITSALQALGSAQSAIARGHGKLRITQVRIGCRTVDTGGQDKDDQDFAPQGAAPLRVVA